MYYGCFSCWSDVADSFGVNLSESEIAVLFAAYETPDYEGYAQVVYVKNGKFYLVTGSHCSCYGLEDQWEPEEMPLEALLRIANDGNGMLNDYRREFKRALEVVQELGLESVTPEDAQLALKLAFG